MKAFQYRVLSEGSVEVGMPSGTGNFFINNQLRQFPINTHSMEQLADCDKVTLTIADSAKFHDFINMLGHSNFVEIFSVPAS